MLLNITKKYESQNITKNGNYLSKAFESAVSDVQTCIPFSGPNHCLFNSLLCRNVTGFLHYGFTLFQSNYYWTVCVRYYRMMEGDTVYYSGIRTIAGIATKN